MSFDYGVAEKEISSHIGNNIKVWPTEGERVALADVDAIPYVVGYTSDLQQYLKMKRDPDWKNSQVFKDKCDHANFLLNRWIEAAKCDACIPFITEGRENFRLKIGKVKPYKGQRMEEKPPFFYEIKEWLYEFHGARLSHKCEADDEISIEAWRRILAFQKAHPAIELWSEAHKDMSNFVVISGDKDLGIIPTWRCPPDGELEWVEPLGILKPNWKTKEITAYEYWPLFHGKPVDLVRCRVLMNHEGKIKIRIKGELECPKLKWEMDHVWYCESQTEGIVKQDTYIRGVNVGKGKFKRVKVGMKESEYIDKLKGVGLKFFYSQLLTGDTVDNYPGLPGCGSTKAYNTLDDCISEWELYKAVRSLYHEHYRKDADLQLLEQGQLAWMQTHREELWTPLSNSNDQSFPA